MWNEFWDERQPDRAKENSPPIHRWVLVRKPMSPARDDRAGLWCLTFSFAPPGLKPFFTRDPRLKPWAIFGRPCRDFATRPESEIPVYHEGESLSSTRCWNFAIEGQQIFIVVRECPQARQPTKKCAPTAKQNETCNARTRREAAQFDSATERNLA